jgi:hypothetical protein
MKQSTTKDLRFEEVILAILGLVILLEIAFGVITTVQHSYVDRVGDANGMDERVKELESADRGAK